MTTPRHPRPPTIARWLLLRMLPADVRDWTAEDLDERYETMVRTQGGRRARAWYRRQLIHAAALGLSPHPRSARHPGARRESPMIGGTPLHVWQDIAFAVRQLRSHPGLTAVVATTLALGIGANTAIFSVLNQVAFRPLPYADGERIAMVWHDAGRSQMTWIALPEYIDYRDRVEAFDDLAAWYAANANITGDGEPERVAAVLVTANTFDVLGVDMPVGRPFTSAEDVPGGPPVAVVSYDLFMRRLGGDASAIGRDMIVDGRPTTIVGVLPRGVRLPTEYGSDQAAQIWQPLALDPQNLPGRNNRSWHAVARLRADATLGSARSEFATLHDGLRAQGLYPADMNGPGLIPVRDFVFGDVRQTVYVVFGAAGFVLLIACANVANLLLAHGEARRREVAVRTALGASRWRLVQQWFTESAVTAVFGGVLGVGLGVVGIMAVRSWGPASIPRLPEIALDAPVLIFSLIVAMGTGLVFGVLPAIHATGVAPQDALQESGRGRSEGTGTRAARNGLIVAELALAVALAVGSALMIRSFTALRSVDIGFQPDQVLTFRIDLPSTRYDRPTAVRFHDEMTATLAELPGVDHAGAARILPLTRTIGDWSITIEGRERRPGENPNGDWQIVVPGYFEAMGIELVGGRFLTPNDRADATPVVVINETMADRYWPGGEALGSRFRIGGPQTPWFTIVGVTRDVRHNTLTEVQRAEMSHALTQWAPVMGAPRGMTYAVRTTADPFVVLDGVRAAVRARDPDLPVADVRAMTQVVADATADTRFTVRLLNVFAAVAVALAAIGVYGVITYSVSRRHREIGIRMAVGADRGRVIRLVLSQTGIVLGIGLAAGVLLAGASAKLLSGLLYQVSPSDPAAYAAVIGLLTVVALSAAYLPARRAASIDPAKIFRD